GAAWDQWSSGGPYLWVWSQDGPTGGPLCTATQIDPSTGMPTGVNFVGVEMNVDPADDDIAGGASISIVTIDSQTHLVFIGLHQSNYLAPGDGLDWIVVYDISVPPVTPNLVSPQDGEVDVQTAPTTLSWQASPTANSYQLQVALSS
ncbi:MAG: hypothetical protein GWN00_17860, partial [Aliifodinibius sp.]|nr:hypothetical protein [Fodinibius sp.]NIW46624.1 hypothetical protein [Gammaproteobacteria bacterium]NIY26600.1 hypothetical protein [Fodinibius sp.]